MWTIRPNDTQLLNMKQEVENIQWAIQRLRDYPAEPGEVGILGLERLTNDLLMLVKMNTRLMVCFAVEAGVMSEGKGAQYLGLDRLTFREIKEAARVWAERAGKGTDGETAGRAAGGSAGEPAQAGVAGNGQGVGGGDQVAGATAP